MPAELPDALILVGGLGTRLRPVIADRPKPLAPVAGRPFVEWLVCWLRGQGVRRIIFCTGYRADLVQSHFGDGTAWDVEISYSVEPEPRGTGGAARLALDLLRTPSCLLLNGDSFCDLSLADLQRHHCQQQAVATMALVQVPDTGRYGAVQVAPNGVVTAFTEKRPDAGAGLINAGVYLLTRELVAAIPAARAVSLERDVFPTLVGHGLHGLPSAGPFIDIGTPESYAAAATFPVWARLAATAPVRDQEQSRT